MTVVSPAAYARCCQWSGTMASSRGYFNSGHLIANTTAVILLMDTQIECDGTGLPQSICVLFPLTLLPSLIHSLSLMSDDTGVIWSRCRQMENGGIF